MKTMGLLFLAMVWAALAPGTVDAVPSDLASAQTSPASSANTASGHPGDAGHAASPHDGRQGTSGTASDEQRNHGRASVANHPPSPTSLNKPNPPEPLPNSRQRPMRGNALHPPGSNQAVGAPRSAFMGNETVHNPSPVRSSSVVRPTAPALNSVPHRSPNPAVVGGSMNLRGGKTGAINGTAMNHKR